MKTEQQIKERIKEFKKHILMPVSDGCALYSEALEWVLSDE